MKRSSFLALFTALSFAACDQMPIDGTNAASEPTTAPQVATTPANSTVDQRVADLEARLDQMSKQMQALQKPAVASDGSVGFGTPAQAGYGLTVSGSTMGVQAIGGTTGINAQGTNFGVWGQGDTGLYGAGKTYGLQVSADTGVYSWGNRYSFYGTGGQLYNAGPVQTDGDLKAEKNAWGTQSGWIQCASEDPASTCACPDGSFVTQISFSATTVQAINCAKL